VRLARTAGLSTERGGLRWPVSAAAAKPGSATARRASERASLAGPGSSVCTTWLRHSAAARAEKCRSGARRFSTPQGTLSPSVRGDRRSPPWRNDGAACPTCSHDALCNVLYRSARTNLGTRLHITGGPPWRA
jgi:hypothetical protein